METGYGGNVRWRSEGDLSTTQDTVVLIAIGDAEKIDFKILAVTR
jgi:hypothetical protein